MGNVLLSPALQSLEFIPHRYNSLPSHVNKGRSEYINDKNDQNYIKQLST